MSTLLSEGDEIEKDELKIEPPTNTATKVAPAGTETKTDVSRQTGDLTVYKYYFKASGWYNVAFIILMASASSFCTVFSSK